MKLGPDGKPIVDEEPGAPTELEDDSSRSFDVDDELDAKGTEGVEVNPDELDAEEKEFDKLDGKAFAAMRRELKESKARAAETERKLQELEKARHTYGQAPVQPVQHIPAQAQREVINGIMVPQTKEEWNELARRDWQVAVDLRSIINSRRITAEAQNANKSLGILETSKQKVISRHPELDDINSEKSQIYLQILDENPEYLNHPKGPIYAMRDMEDILEGKFSDKKNSGAQREALRTTRTALTGGGKLPATPSKSITLTKDDLEFCKTNEIDPKDYARQKLNLENSKKGVQL